MSDILPLAQWSESRGDKVARPYGPNYIRYAASTYTIFVTTQPPRNERAAFVQTSPGRWSLMPNPTNEPALKVVKRGDRTYVYVG